MRMRNTTKPMSDKDIRKIKAGDILRMSKGDFEVIVSFFDEDIQEQTIIIASEGKAKVCANGDIIEALHKK